MAAAPGLAIFGVTGRMGRALIDAIRMDPHWRLQAAVAAPTSAALGADAGGAEPLGVPVTADAEAALAGGGGAAAAAAIDFSVPQAVAAHARYCAAAGVPLLVGVTGYDTAVRGELEAAARRIPVLIAPNTSLGVAVVARLAAAAAAALGPGFDVEILEAHHKAKRDAPSGTALRLGEAVAAARGRTLAEVAVFDRHTDVAPRAAGSIGFAVIRAGDIVGEHTVIFAGAGERVEISHKATDRRSFARGALHAARWLVGRSAGLYRMEDVLSEGSQA